MGSIDSIRGLETWTTNPENYPSDYDIVFVGSSCWADTLQPAVRTYLNQERGMFRNIAFFATSDRGNAKNLFTKMLAMTIEEIEEEIKNCRGKGKPVQGEGPEDARLMFIGMAPGKEEPKTGRPFVGRAGNFLDQMLESIGIGRKEMYLTSPIKYYPGDRIVAKDAIRHGAEHLKDQMTCISPRMVILMGNIAAKVVFPEKKINGTKNHGSIINKNGICFFITLQPLWDSMILTIWWKWILISSRELSKAVCSKLF